MTKTLIDEFALALVTGDNAEILDHAKYAEYIYSLAASLVAARGKYVSDEEESEVAPEKPAATQEQLNDNLLHAAFWGAGAAVKAAIESGADVNAKDNDGTTALMLAAINGHADSAQALISAGADVNAKDNYGNTALMFSQTRGHKDCAELLKQAGAK